LAGQSAGLALTVGPRPPGACDNSCVPTTQARSGATMISNELQLEPWRARLRAHGRVQIPGFLQEEAAERLHQCLRDEVPWEIAQRTGAELPPGLPREAAPGSE